MVGYPRSKSRSSSLQMQASGSKTQIRMYPSSPPDVTTWNLELQSPTIKRESVAYEAHKAPFLEGGPFALRRYRLDRGIVTNSFRDGYNEGWRNTETTGNFRMQGDFTIFGLPNIFDESILAARFAQAIPPLQPLDAYGEQALNRINPLDLSESSIIQSIVELYREGLPSIPGATIRKTRELLKGSGGEYLNAVFGWAPLANDVKAIYDCYRKMDSLFKRLKAENGKKVRRKATLVNDTTRTTDTYIGPCLAYPQDHYTNNVPGQSKTMATLDIEDSTRIWVVGAGSYYIPDIDSVEFHKKFLEQIYGARPSLAILYELMPWSWLIDYFTNVGDVIQYHFGPQLGTYVHQYSYLMRHRKITKTYRGGSGWTWSQPDAYQEAIYKPAPEFIAREVYETKERIAATPYGFGLKLSDLSSKQLAILTALGLSKQSFL